MKKLISFILLMVLSCTTLITGAQATLDEYNAFPMDVAKHYFIGMPGWDEFADDTDNLALLVAAVLTDADAAIADLGFNSADAKEIIITVYSENFFYIEVYMEDGYWSLGLLYDRISAYWHDYDDLASYFIMYGIKEDPVGCAEQLLETGYYESIVHVTDELLAHGYALLAEKESIGQSGDVNAYFRNADKVYAFRCGYAAFLYQERGGFISTDGTVTMHDDWDACSAVIEAAGLMPVYTGPYSYGMPYGGNWGFAAFDGSLVVPIEYSSYEFTYNDPGVISLKKDGHYSYYDANTAVMHTPAGFDAEAHVYSNGMVAVYEGPLNDNGNPEGGKWGFADWDGNVLIPLTWDSVTYAWSDGYNKVSLNGLYGIIDSTGNLVAPCEYDKIGDIMGDYYLAQKSGVWYVMDFDGNVLSTHTTKYAYLHKPGYVNTYETFENDGALYTLDGNTILSASWYDIRPYNENIVRLGVKDAEGNKWFGIADLYTGEVLQQFGWQDIYNEADGMLRVKRDDLFGYLDSEYNEVIAPAYEEATDFNNGYACVKKDGQWYIIDHTGAIVY